MDSAGTRHGVPWRVVTSAGFLLAIVLGTGAGAADVRAPVSPAERAIEQVTKTLLDALADPSPAAAKALRERVRAGVPPRALLKLLDRYRAAPRADVLDVVKSLTGYRRIDVRARALAAWAATDKAQAELAIAAAARDVAPSIRKLAVGLAKQYPSKAAELVIDELLARDEALAAEVDGAKP
jgi:hypothetical protein